MTQVKSLRALEAEWRAYSNAAQLAGLPLNGWIRRALNSAAELEEALKRMDSDFVTFPNGLDKPKAS